MEDSVLSKSSSEEELRRYFTAILELSKQDNEFPINLDEVWMLAYSGKNKAVRALKNNFIESEDFTTMTQNGQGGKFDTTVYYLSVSCLEYFIARKVRSVFEVYRQVFHKVTNNDVKLPSNKELALMVIKAEEEKEKLLLENMTLEENNSKLRPKAEFADAAFKATESFVDIGEAAKILNLPFGRNTLFKRLREDGVFFEKKNEPKQKYITARYFILTQLPPIERGENKPPIIPVKVLCTQKGLAFINLKYGGTQEPVTFKKAIR